MHDTGAENKSVQGCHPDTSIWCQAADIMSDFPSHYPGSYMSCAPASASGLRSPLESVMCAANG